MSPITRYRDYLTDGSIQPDPLQEHVALELQKLYETLSLRQSSRFLKKWLLLPQAAFSHNGKKGIYLWGDVGVGKTFLMDIFYESVTLPKMRLHFHQWMARIHQELRSVKGKNPLKQVVKRLTGQARVICLDEFLVNDIVDAMLLAGLLEQLFAKDIYFLTTSNCAPENLYLKGLQRDQFLPAIDLLQQHLQVIHLPSHTDYRRIDHAVMTDVYLTPSDHAAKSHLKHMIHHFADAHRFSYEPLHVLGRDIAVKMQAPGVVWFDFMDICGVPRSQLDYLAIATQYHTVFVSDVPDFLPEQHDLVRAFINMVDILYDYKVRLILTAAVPLEQLYLQGKLTKEFVRTRSRLFEMQSSQWGRKQPIDNENKD